MNFFGASPFMSQQPLQQTFTGPEGVTDAWFRDELKKYRKVRAPPSARPLPSPLLDPS